MDGQEEMRNQIISPHVGETKAVKEPDPDQEDGDAELKSESNQHRRPVSTASLNARSDFGFSDHLVVPGSDHQNGPLEQILKGNAPLLASHLRSQ